MDYEVMMNGTVRLGMKIQDFDATTTFGPIKFSEYKKGKWCVFFSHPRRFYPSMHN